MYVGAVRLLAATCLVLAVGCGEDPATLVVSLKTDFVPEVELAHVVVRAGGLERTFAARAGQPFTQGVTVAELGGLDAVAEVRVDVELRDRAGRVLAARPVLADLRARAVSITVVVTRSCRDVVCNTGSACLGGRCVSERCTEETPELCGAEAAECDADADCPPMDECSTPSCQLGACLYAAVEGSCDDGSACVPDRGCVEMPVSGDAGLPLDAGAPDAGGPPAPDAGGPCEGVVCGELERCVDGGCVPLEPCRGDGTCAVPTDVCHGRRCVPGDVDLDGDGAVASVDCDELDPARFPGNREDCNLVDDDCDDVVDDGDPATLCESNPGGGICLAGSCGCPPGTYDLDRAVAGCECVAMPALDRGNDCAGAIDVGTLDDSGASVMIGGNVMPDDRETWYRFRGADSADVACDNYHVRAYFTANPGDTFELTVFRGACGATAECADSGFTDYSWATDFRAVAGGLLSGQCPCTAVGGPPAVDQSACADDSADYFVRVRRRAGSALSCDSYAIELSNGLYDTI